MISKSANFSTSLLGELQDALRNGNVARRVETLRRVTDLFVHAADDYSDEQISVFDEVFNCLTQHIETSAKALLANRLAPIPKAPPQLMHTLAFDDLIEVAAPVLSLSDRLDDTALIENARLKSQDHLLAISKRKVLSGAVTDVLVERGNDQVIESTVKNPGAVFSEQGFDRLVTRAEGDDNLATSIGLRKSIPRHRYLKLIVRASASVRERLQAANPQFADDISSAVNEVTLRTSEDTAGHGEGMIRAQGLVKSLYDDGRLNEAQIAAFATANRFDETTAAFAMLTNTSISTVETMMMEPKSEGLLVLAKVAGLSWVTLDMILSMRDKLTGNAPMTGLEDYRDSYELLRASTAQQVLRFHRMQQSAEVAAPAA